MLKKSVVLLAFLLLIACSHVPWSTMFKLRAFDVDDFVALDPDQLRIQVISHNGVSLDFERVMMDFKLGAENHAYEQSIDLDLLSESREADLIIYQLALTPKAKTILHQTQDFMTQHKDANVGFNIKTPMPVDGSVDTMTLTINMLFNNEYLTLLDELVLDTSRFKTNKNND